MWFEIIILSVVKYVWRVRTSNSHTHTKTHTVPLPLDTSLLFIKGNRSREHKALCARKCVCVCVQWGVSSSSTGCIKHTVLFLREPLHWSNCWDISLCLCPPGRTHSLSHTHIHIGTHTYTQFPNQLIALRATNYANKPTKIETQPQHKALWDSK